MAHRSERERRPGHQQRTYAIRLDGRPGWQLIVACSETDARHLGETEFACDVVEVLPTDMTALTQEPKLRVLGIRDQDLRFWNGQSWVYDEVESCWRGVDQPIVPPPGTPTPVDKLDVGFTTPDAGWVYMKVAGPAQDVTIPLSNSFDAFEDLVRWLEAILDGGSPRYMINTEGSLDEFHLFSADRDRLRFVIAYVHYDPPAVPTRRLALDVLISRRALLRSFSEPFHDYWHGDELKKHWTEWVFDLKNPDEAPFVPERLREPSDTLTWRLRAFLGHR